MIFMHCATLHVSELEGFWGHNAMNCPDPELVKSLDDKADEFKEWVKTEHPEIHRMFW